MRIAITGPESSGKTTLAKALAQKHQIRAVPEFARYHLTKYGAGYEAKDILYFAEAQLALERRISLIYPHLLITDSDLLVLKIWHEEKFGPCPPALENWYRQTNYDLILLCAPDLAWTPDPLRENPIDRLRLFERYLEESQQRNQPFKIIQGAHRFEQAIKFIENL